MHMLSEIMEPVLHKDCPPNCQDLLTWLPAAIIHRILTFLDPGNANNIFQRFNVIICGKTAYRRFLFEV